MSRPVPEDLPRIPRVLHRPNMTRNAQSASVSPFSGLMKLSLDCGGGPTLFMPTELFGIVGGITRGQISRSPLFFSRNRIPSADALYVGNCDS